MGAMAGDVPTIQASSLSDITSIADSPPDKPSARRNGGKQLVLYIARVPGSRDIFLTPLKPRDKVVTDQDISSCLYYCHLETENDDLIRREDDYFGTAPTHDNPYQDASSPSSLHSPNSPIFPARASSLTPVAGPEHGSTFDMRQLAPALPPRPEEAVPAIKRKPVNSVQNSTSDPFIAATDTEAPILPPRPAQVSTALPPRPIGPRPLVDRGQSENNVNPLPPIVTEFAAPQLSLQKPLQIPRRPVPIPSSSPHLKGETTTHHALPPSDGPGKENIDSRVWEHQPPSHHPPVPLYSFEQMLWTKPPQPSSLSSRSPMSSLNRSNSLVSNIPAGLPSSKSHAGFNVSLTRRNPSEGSQQVVGKMTIPAATHIRYGQQNKVLLQMFNPGYEKFRASRLPSTAELVRCIDEDDDCTFSTNLRLATRKGSVKSPTSPYFGDVPINQLVGITPSQPYSFVGPWNRVCEFTTSISGRSLKCRHMLARGNAMNGDPNSMNVLTLSDLRFNTPSTTLFAKSKTGNPTRKNEEKRRPWSAVPMMLSKSAPSHENHRKSMPTPDAPPQASGHRPHLSLQSHGLLDDLNPGNLTASVHSHDSNSASGSPSTFASNPMAEGPAHRHNDSDIEPMDLGLGQERAGGGFKGNKAKLGKLVVEPEGLEMLDLLVAANMGIWWSR